MFVKLEQKFHQKRVRLHRGSEAIVSAHWRRFARRLGCSRRAIGTTVRRLEDRLRVICTRGYWLLGAKNHQDWSLRAHCPPSGVSTRYAVRQCHKPFLCPFCYGRRLLRLYEFVLPELRKYPTGGLLVLRDEEAVEKFDATEFRRRGVGAVLRLKRRLKQTAAAHVGGFILRMAFPTADGRVVFRTQLAAMLPNRESLPYEIRSAGSGLLLSTASPRQTALFLLRRFPYPRRLVLGESQKLAEFWRARLTPPTTRSLVFFGEWATLGGDVSA